MHPIHDVDVLLLLATSLAAKRRPAELIDIMAAIDLLQNNIPAEQKLSESIARLSSNGLLAATESSLALTPEAEQLVVNLPRKAETDERLFMLKDRMSEYTMRGEHASAEIAPEALRSAMLAHRAASKSGAKNLLVPKPKPVEPTTRPGQRQRKPAPTRRRKP